VFDDEPHYHYNHRHDDGTVENQVVDFDPVAGGDMLPWAIGCLRDRLVEMLEAAGGGRLVDQLESSLIGEVLSEVVTTAEYVRARQP